MRRRAALLLLLGGCGYRTDSTPAGPVSGGGQVQFLVAAREERKAQLLRDYLDIAMARANLGPRIAGVALRLEIDTQELAIRRDETPSRARLSATVVYVATPRGAAGAAPAPLRGTVRVTEGYNVVDQEFFATDSAREAAERRLMEQAADQIARRLQAATI
jgi:hypothetical protein